MKIGIDVDNVISDFNEKLLKAYIKHDKRVRGSGIVNENASYIRHGMFDWSKEEEDAFYHANIERIAKKLKVKSGVRRYVNKLRRGGHYICIITGRNNGEYTDAYGMTREWLDKHHVRYDELILTDVYKRDEKAICCVENGMDVMLDDSVDICRCCVEKGIKTYLMDTPYNKYADMERVCDFKDFYNRIKAMN